MRHGRLEHIEHGALPFAHRQTADRVAVETDCSQFVYGAFAQTGIDAALDDAETGTRSPERSLRALRPAHRKRERRFDLGFRRRERWALIEHHLDIRAQQALDLHGAFRREEVLRAVNVRTEANRLLRDFA